MRHLFIIISIFILSLAGLTQQTINGSITHDSMQRDYILYIPANYTVNLSVPLILNFHGYGSNAFEQMIYGDFRSIADTAGFLLIHPEGTLFNGTTHWNVGGWTVGSTVDDIGFTEALIDSLTAIYNIDETRIYATGMSNGGFMSFLLACQLSEKIAAIASVTGSMTTETYNNGNPQHPTPVLQMHGTEDALVPYNGASWTKSIDDVMQYWAGYNNCNTIPDITALPDLDPNDGSTVERFIYDGGDNGVTVEHYKITGGAHTWPGSAIAVPGTNYDIDASIEIWNFFSRYDIYGLINTTGFEQLNKSVNDIIIFPNPANSFINVELLNKDSVDYELFSPLGKQMMKGKINSKYQKIDLSELSTNIYFLRIGNKIFKVVKTE